MQTVILHGWGQSGALWQSLAEKLGNGAQVIDLPGFGSEPLAGKNWGVPEYADWVMGKIDKHSLVGSASKKKQTIIIGHSFGGRVAAEIASRNPKWLKGLVLSGAPCLYRPSRSIIFKIKLYKLLKFLIPKKMRRFFYSGDLRKASGTKLEKILRKVVVYDQTEQLKKIKAPTLLIWGENDENVPLRIAREMNSLIKNSDLKIIENAGHNSYFDSPNLFYGYIANFISNIK